MCRQIGQGKDMSNLWIILCVLCSYSKTEFQTVHIVKNKTDWFTASQTCTMQQGRLPGVNIYDHRLKLKDVSVKKNISFPFWIAATYDFMDCNHFEPHYENFCPDTFCQTIAMSSGKLNVEWRPCSECNNASCAISPITIYEEADWICQCKDWPGAFQECKARNLSLATRENAQFIQSITNSTKTFWLNDIPQINLAPDIRMKNRTCLYSFNGIIHEGNCSDTSMTTVCIIMKTTGMTTMVPSQTEYTAGIWPILGSALGGFVVIIIVVLVIILVLRRRRMKNDPEKAFNSNTNNKPATKNMSETKNAYDTVLGESFVLEATIATSTGVSTAQEEEPVIYARPQKVKKNCGNPIDVPFSIKQPTGEKENTGLYNVVQKGKKTHCIPNAFGNDDVLGKDYYDISFTEPEKEDSVENVYNKANFNHSIRDEDQTINMYDKANFSHEINENNTGYDYDEANFRHEILENNSGNDYDKANFRNVVLLRDSEDEYEKELFHRS